MKQTRQSIRIAIDNEHLLDVFSSHHFIEIGHIDDSIINRLLANKVVKLDQIADFNVQSVGIGHSNHPDLALASHLPYLFFSGINEENLSMQVFLTYGLLIHEDNQGNEHFAPLVLLPITLHYENETFYASLDANPIANEVLVTHYKNRNVTLPTDKLESIFDFMRYCMNVAKATEQPLRFENYLTFARTVQPQIVMNHDRFSLSNNLQKPLEHRLFHKDSADITFIDTLSYRQRQAIERAHYGNSFAIVGPIGTGKTTTLLNIAMNAIVHNQKVLYLSSQKRTLEAIEQQLDAYKLHHLFINLAHSFNNIILKSKYNHRPDPNHLDPQKITQHLDELYEYLEQYEKITTDRVMNFRFIEVLSRLLLEPVPNDAKPLDDLSNIYKHEYNEIITSIKAIEEDLHKIPSFKESKFINIPVNHQIEYPNQILTLLFEIHRNFNRLYEVTKVLQQEHHLARIPNYARFKNVINNIRALSWEKVPSSWKKKDLRNYHKANHLYQQIKSEIYSLQQQELYLDWDYQNLHDYDVHQAIDTILDGYWKEDDQEPINILINHHEELMSQLRIGIHNIRVFNEATTKLQSVLMWNFDPSDDDVASVIIELTDFLKKHKTYYKWLNLNRYQELRKELVNTRNKLKRYEILENQYLRYFASIDEVDNNIIYLVKMEAKGKTSAKFKGIMLEDLIKDMKEFKSLSDELTDLKQQYTSITGLEYLRSEDILQDFDACYGHLTSIVNEDHRRHVVKFLSEVNEENLKEYLQELNSFVYSHQIASDIYQMIIPYFPSQDHPNHAAKRYFIEEAYRYISRVHENNIKGHDIIKKSSDNVRFEEYLLLRDRQTSLANLKDQIVNNKDYHILYGKLFVGEKTNINELGTLIKAYGLYVECFDDPDFIKSSLEEPEITSILGLLNQTDSVFKDLTEQFKVYSKLFKDGIGGFYYDDFEVTIHRVSELMNAKDELLVYLDITNQLKTLYHYKLFLLSNLIVNNEVTELVVLFNYTYFSKLYQDYLKKYPRLRETQAIMGALMDLEETEKAYCTACLHRLIKEHDNSVLHLGYRPQQYNDFIRKTDKCLYMATPAVLNNFIDVNLFDLVVIDDAQMLHANEYYLAVQAKQLVIAGEDIIHTKNQISLLSRMRSNYIVNFQERFPITPLQLSMKIPNLKAPFYRATLQKQAIRIVHIRIIDEIFQLIHKNQQLRINIYVRNLATKWSIYEEFSALATLNGLSNHTIEQILSNQLLIVDLLSGYSRLADVNILYLQDYFDLDVEYVDATRLSNLLLPTQQLILFDPDDVMKEDSSYPFIHILRSLLTSSLNPFVIEQTTLYKRMKSYLLEQGFEVLGAYGNISMILKRNDYYYGLILYYDIEREHFQMVEDYRTYQNYGGTEGIKVYTLYAIDLYEQFDLTMANFLKDVRL